MRAFKYLSGFLILAITSCSTTKPIQETRQPAQFTTPADTGLSKTNRTQKTSFYLERQRWTAGRSEWKYCAINTTLNEIHYNSNPKNSNDMKIVKINQANLLKQASILHRVASKILAVLPQNGPPSESLSDSFPGYFSYSLMVPDAEEKLFTVKNIWAMSNDDYQATNFKPFAQLHKSCETRQLVQLMDEICNSAINQKFWDDVPSQFYPPNCK